MKGTEGWRAIRRKFEFTGCYKLTLVVFVMLGLPDNVEAGFKCGKIECKERGFDYCILPPLVADGDSECWPCHIRKDKCGTIDEQIGCNLYCQDLLKQEYIALIKEMEEKHQLEMEEANKKNDEARTEAAAKEQIMTNVSKRERQDHDKQMKALNSTANECFVQLKHTNENLHKKHIHLLIVGWVLGGCVSMLIVGGLCCKIRLLPILKQLPEQIIELYRNRNEVKPNIDETSVLEPLADKSMVQVNSVDNRLTELVVG